MSNKYIIYKRTNLINGKVYIGYTQREVKLRWRQEELGDQVISKAIQKYGTQNFKNEIIETVNSKNKMMERELYWIHFYDSGNPKKGYNIINSGQDKSDCIKSSVKTGKYYIWVDKKLLFRTQKDVKKYLGKLATYFNRPFYRNFENKESPIWSLMTLSEYDKLVNQNKINKIPFEELTLVSFD